MTGMLDHIRVIDMTQGLGDFAGRMLSELGAEVLKVEPREAGERTVAWKVWNAGKRSLALDLDDAADREGLLKLAAEADIILSHGTLDDAELERRNPRLIRVVIAPSSADGPYKDRPVTDLTLLAASGLLNMGGDPDRAPLRFPGEQAYALTGIQGATAALTALYARHAAGRGQRVEVSALQSAVLAGYRDPIVWEWTGRVGVRTGNQLVRGTSGVKQVFPCADGYITWGLVDNPGMLKGLTKLMQADGADEGMADQDWDNILLADAPQKQIDAWERTLEAWFKTKRGADLMKLSGELGLGLSRIDTADDVLASPQFAARHVWRKVDGMTVPGALFQTSETFDPPAAGAPAHGEANVQFGFEAAQ